MKKLSSIILPYLLLCLIFIYDHMNPYKDFLIVAIVILFPIIFICQGIKCSSIIHIFTRLILPAVVMLLFFEKWYYIADTFRLVLSYIGLGLAALLIKKVIIMIKRKVAR